MEDLKLCVITQSLPNIKGGHILAFNLLKILEPLSNEIFMITGNFPEDLILDRKIHIKNVKRDSKRETMWIRTFKYILTQLRISLKLIKISKNVDIVIFFVGGMALLLPMLSAKLMRKKVVLIATGSGSESAKRIYDKRLFGMGGFIFSHILGILEKINYNLSDSLVIESYRLVPLLKLQKYKNKIYKGALFVDTKIFKKTMKEQNMIGYIGRLSEEKGVLNFVKAIPEILKEREDLEFLIGGDGQLREEVEGYLEKENLNDKVELTGWILHDKLPDYLNELKLVVIPSYTEGLPNIMFEAMACGIPVLATAVGGIPDIITDGETGFIMEDNSLACIAKNVVRALEHPDLERIVENARALVEHEFTYEKAVERWGEILEEICDDRR